MKEKLAGLGNVLNVESEGERGGKVETISEGLFNRLERKVVNRCSEYAGREGF